ncbi:MAG: hypothetical protein LUQ61_04170 [Methanoregulaceae archaeon]|nr:hypothetical protein [Methanoregulaceae archaeon]
METGDGGADQSCMGVSTLPIPWILSMMVLPSMPAESGNPLPGRHRLVPK